MRLFISYAHDDFKKVEKLVGVLQGARHDPWFDTQLKAGENWKSKLEEEIRASDIFIYALSPASIASEWCQWEFATAVKFGKPIIPILLEESTLPVLLKDYHYFDLRTGFRGNKKRQLIRELNDFARTLDAMQKPASEDRERRLEAAMPSQMQRNTTTEVWVKVSLPGSDGLRAELPAHVASGDLVHKGDVQGSSFPLRFFKDPATGDLMPGEVCLQVVSDDFDVTAEFNSSGRCSANQILLELLPDHNSRTVIFTLSPKEATRQGRSRVRVALYQAGLPIAETSLNIKIVNVLDQPRQQIEWRLAVMSCPRTLGQSQS